MTRPTSTRDLLPSERTLVQTMSQLGFGRFEHLRIRNGQIALDPWPPTIRQVKFGAVGTSEGPMSPEFELKAQVVDFFEYVRAIGVGEIRTLEVRHGLPFSLEIEVNGGAHNA